MIDLNEYKTKRDCSSCGSFVMLGSYRRGMEDEVTVFGICKSNGEKVKYLKKISDGKESEQRGI